MQILSIVEVFLISAATGISFRTEAFLSTLSRLSGLLLF